MRCRPGIVPISELATVPGQRRSIACCAAPGTRAMLARMPASRVNVFTIPASAPFLAVLIDALRAGRLVPGFPANADPLELARATIYLPTRRACRLARDVFLDRLGTDAAILPRLVPLGDIDEDEIAFAEAATAELAEAALAIPKAIDSLERRLLLAELILKWANSPEVRGAEGSPLIANTPSAALGLADDLARLMDDMTTRQVGWDRLDTLVPDDLDPYWQLSLRFLKIAREAWPALRAERGAIEAAERRDRLIEAEAKRLAGSDAPVIAAGSTGSMPATAKLLATIAALPHGAVVLPGLDTDLDEPSWQLIAGNDDDQTHDGMPAAGHAQFAMQALLARMGIARDEVVRLGEASPREALVSEALRPASTTEHWQLQPRARHVRGRRRRRARLARPDRGGECRGRSARHRRLPARGHRDAGQARGADHARPHLGAPRRRGAFALARAGRQFRRRRARRYAGRPLRAPDRGSGAQGSRAGDAAGAAQEPAAALRPGRARARARHFRAGARAAARAAAEAGHGRSGARARNLPRHARRHASQRPALAHRRDRSRCRRGVDRQACRGAGAARKAAARRPRAGEAGRGASQGHRGAVDRCRRHRRRLRGARRHRAGARLRGHRRQHTGRRRAGALRRRLCRHLPGRDRRPRRAPPRGARRARAHLRAARSALAVDRPRRARRPQRGDLAAGDAQRSLAQPADAAAARARSAGAAHRPRPRTTSPRRSAPARWCCRGRRRSPARRRSPRASCSASPRSPAKRAGRPWQNAARTTSRWHARSTSRNPSRRPSARRRSRRSTRGRRNCRSRPSKTGCATLTRSTPGTSSICSRSTPSIRRRAHATAAPSSTAPSAITRGCSPEQHRPIRCRNCSRSAKRASSRSPTIRRRRRSGGRVTSASPAGSRNGICRGATASWRCTPRSAAN